MQWTDAWIRRLAEATVRQPVFSFNAGCRQQVQDRLSEQSDDHCSFCDRWPHVPLDIEHFKPKVRFPELAYDWANLYGSCSHCNGAKGERFDERILRPDDVDYSFDRFFDVTTTFELQPHPAAAPDDRERARVTIEMYKLNRAELRLARKHRAGDPRVGVGEFRFLDVPSPIIHPAGGLDVANEPVR